MSTKKSPPGQFYACLHESAIVDLPTLMQTRGEGLAENEAYKASPKARLSRFSSCHTSEMTSFQNSATTIVGVALIGVLGIAHMYYLGNIESVNCSSRLGTNAAPERKLSMKRASTDTSISTGKNRGALERSIIDVR
jgi:hypothetical protein